MSSSYEREWIDEHGRTVRPEITVSDNGLQLRLYDTPEAWVLHVPAKVGNGQDERRMREWGEAVARVLGSLAPPSTPAEGEDERRVRVGDLVLTEVLAEDVQKGDRIYEAGRLTDPAHVPFRSSHDGYEPENEAGEAIHFARAGQIVLVERPTPASTEGEDGR